MSNKHGLIIMGYPGIGKTTLANANMPYSKIIDLESSLFNIGNNKIDDNWGIIYCKVAVELALQGFIVLVSSHYEVQIELEHYARNRNDITIVTISPEVFLKDEWVMKLHDRFLKEETEKNEKAWKRAEGCYTSDIYALASNTSFSHIYLPNDHYDLYRIVMSLYDIYCNNRTRGTMEC